MSIDKAIRYEQIKRDGDKVKVAFKPNTVSNGYDHHPNVIPIGPIPHERPWYDELPFQEEDESRKKRPGRRYASYEPEIDNAIIAFEFWSEKWLAHPLRDKFKTLKDFISWSTANEDQPFSRGGLVSIINI